MEQLWKALAPCWAKWGDDLADRVWDAMNIVCVKRGRIGEGDAIDVANVVSDVFRRKDEYMRALKCADELISAVVIHYNTKVVVQ